MSTPKTTPTASPSSPSLPTPQQPKYPNFDDEWRQLKASLKAAETVLQEHLKELTGPSATAIRSALQDLVQKRKDYESLSANIITNYKRSKNENIELQAQAAKIDKYEKDAKLAVVKVKEYKPQVSILKKQVIGLGGTVQGLAQETVKCMKRSIDQVEPKENHHQAPMPYPPHEVWGDLSEKEQQVKDFLVLNNKLTMYELKKKIAEQKYVSQAKALVDFVA